MAYKQNESMSDLIDAQLSAVAARYTEESYWSRLRRMSSGLRAPRQTREYKMAMIELQRLSAPVSAVALPALLVTLLVLLGAGTGGAERYIETEILEMEAIQDLQDPEDYEPPPDRPDDLDVDIQVDSPNVDVANPVDRQTAYSPQPQMFDAVQIVKSPVILRGIFGDVRNTGTRGSAMRRHGGDQRTEDAVLRALRWLKLKQNADGSWSNNRIAMTSLAVLTFLAHGEKPGDSEEFGETIQRALEYLISKQRADGLFDKGTGDNNNYSHPIAAYALAEAYGMTLNPNVKTVAEKALVPIIQGQTPQGGWDYNMRPGPNAEGAFRNDTSYMGWCAQALKAAKLAKLQVSGLDNAIRKAVGGFKLNAAPGGGFGYTSPGLEGMTAIGVLSMQLLGAADDRTVKLALDQMQSWKPSFAEREPNARGHNNSPQYYYYYATQAKFHAYLPSNPIWVRWNNEMKSVYVAEQKIQKNAIKDHKGQDQDVGWWENNDNHSDRPVMDTCLAALQLMVYYRYLPTTQEAAVRVEEEIAITSNDTDDITVISDL